MGNFLATKCEESIRRGLLKKLNEETAPEGWTAPLPTVPNPGEVGCRRTTQIGVYIQMEDEEMREQLPPRIEGVSAGLEYLDMVDKVIWNKINDPFEVSSSAERGSCFSVKNLNEEQIFFCQEEVKPLQKACGPFRSFILHVYDNFNREVFQLQRVRPFKTDEYRIECPPGRLISVIVKDSIWFSLDYFINNSDGEYFELKGPGILKQFSSNLAWKATRDHEEIGKIEKKRLGPLIKEDDNDWDKMEVSFGGGGLDAQTKAVLLGASFLLDCYLIDTLDSNTANLLFNIASP